MSKKLEKILDECLARILTGGEDINQCLRDYPDVAGDLEPLLRTAMAVNAETASIQPRPAFKSLAKQRFMDELQSSKQSSYVSKRVTLFGWQRRWAVVVVTLLLIVLIGGGGTVAASANSMPDSFLYPVKIATENIQMAFTRSDLAKAELEAKFADRRVNEITKMAEENKEKDLENAAERLAAHLERIGNLAAAQKAKGTIKEEDIAKFKNALTTYATKHPVVLKKAMEKVTVEAKVAIRNVIDTSENKYVTAIQDVNIAAQTNRIDPNTAETMAIRTKTVRGVIRLITDHRWIVNGEVINIDAQTVIRGTPKVGFVARVDAIVRHDGSLLAKRILTQSINSPTAGDTSSINSSQKGSDNGGNTDKKTPIIRTFKGAITVISDRTWIVGARKVPLSADTVVEGTPKIGHSAEVTIQINPDGSLKTQKIVVNSNRTQIQGNTSEIEKPISLLEHPTPSNTAENTPQIEPKPTTILFKGEIKRITESAWVIANRTVPVSTATMIEGTPQIGHNAEVTLGVKPDGSFVVEKIVVYNQNAQTVSPSEIAPNATPASPGQRTNMDGPSPTR